MIKVVGIFPNKPKDPEFEAVKELADHIIKKGLTPIIEEKFAKECGLEAYAVDEEAIFSQSDLVVLLGGDGTILGIINRVKKYGTLLLGINLGHLGFLTDVDRSGMLESFDKVIAGDYRVEKRMMLDTIIDTGEKELVYTSINEVGFYMGGIIETGVYVNDEYIDNFYGDGVLVSSPTGSTAYSLAAGGPILKTDANMMAITPICPHMLHARSIVIGAEDVVKIRINSYTLDCVKTVIDGMPVYDLKLGDEIIVKKSDYCLNIVKTNNLGFYDVLRNKMFGKEGK